MLDRLVKRIPGPAKKRPALRYECHADLVHGVAPARKAIRRRCFRVLPNPLDQRRELTNKVMRCLRDRPGSFEHHHERRALGLLELQPDLGDARGVERYGCPSGSQFMEEGLVGPVSGPQGFEEGKVGSLSALAAPALMLNPQLFDVQLALCCFSALFRTGCDKGGEGGPHNGAQHAHDCYDDGGHTDVPSPSVPARTPAWVEA